PNDVLISDASTFALDGAGHLIVGGDPGSTLVRYTMTGTEVDDLTFELHLDGELKPWEFDGGSLYAGTSGVLHSTPKGLRSSTPAPSNFVREGDAVSFALD